MTKAAYTRKHLIGSYLKFRALVLAHHGGKQGSRYVAVVLGQ